MEGGGEFVLAIDLGSGGPKVALVSDEGEVVDQAKRATGTTILEGGGAEQDPLEWWKAIDAAAKEIIARRRVPPDRIIAVACAAQWSVTVPVDKAGEPLMPAIHWMDSRGAPHSKRITDGLIKVAGYNAYRLFHWIRLTGGAPAHSGADSLSHILYVKHGRPDVYAQTHKFLEPADFISHRLSGVMAASPPTIFPYLLTDNRDASRIDYAPKLLEWSGIDREKLPDIRPVDTVLGPVRPEIAADWGISPQTKVVVGTADSQAAVLGSGAVLDFDGHICVGTSSWLSCHVPWKRTDINHYLATMPAAIPGRNMVMAEQGAAGKCLELFLDGWLTPTDGSGRPPTEAFLDEAAKAAPGSGGLIFLPWLNGAGPPSGDGDVRGGFVNQTLSTTRAEAIRAILEGVAMNVRWVRGHVERFIGRRFESLNFIGGAARSELWRQIMADVVDRPIRQVADPHFAIVRGASFSALMALGKLKLADLPAKTRIEKTIHPDPARREMYNLQFEAFLANYRTQRKIAKRLASRRGLFVSGDRN